ncbi:MAG: aspartyl/asparaginyl beta-hydroxylase domain-containing protein, partial [Pseudonocardiaceae bacterium]
ELGNSRVDHKKEINRPALTSLHALLPGIAAVHRCSRDFAGALHAQVPPHVDSNPSSLVPHKVHVPLITNPNVTFVIDDERHHLAVGRAYEINNLLVHSVENAGDLDRVHFIFEIYPTGVVTSGAAR